MIKFNYVSKIIFIENIFIIAKIAIRRNIKHSFNYDKKMQYFLHNMILLFNELFAITYF